MKCTNEPHSTHSSQRQGLPILTADQPKRFTLKPKEEPKEEFYQELLEESKRVIEDSTNVIKGLDEYFNSLPGPSGTQSTPHTTEKLSGSEAQSRRLRFLDQKIDSPQRYLPAQSEEYQLQIPEPRIEDPLLFTPPDPVDDTPYVINETEDNFIVL